MTFRHTRWRFVATMSALGLALAIGVAGCGGSENATSADSAAGGQGPAAPVLAEKDGAKQEGGAQPGAAQNGAPAQVPDKLEPEERSIIYTGTVTVRVSDVDKAASDANTLATSAGGFVGGDERRSDSSRSEARIILRVPSARFNSVVNDLAKLGKEESRSVSTQDVTEQLVDLEARIANGQASVERVRALLARAQTISEIVSLEAELSRREADLESLKGRKRKLDDLTALSTVTVVLLGPKASVDSGSDPDDGFLGQLKESWSALLDSTGTLVKVIATLAPWLLVIGVPLVFVIWLVRRRGPGIPVAAGAQPRTGQARSPFTAVGSPPVTIPRPVQPPDAPPRPAGDADRPEEPSQPATPTDPTRPDAPSPATPTTPTDPTPDAPSPATPATPTEPPDAPPAPPRLR